MPYEPRAVQIGGSACGYQTGFGLLASLVRVQRTTSLFMFMRRRAWHEGPLCTRSVSCGWRRAIGLLRALPLGAGAACQAGEPRRRLPAAVRAPHGELPWRDAEDSGQPLDLLGGESPLPSVAVSFGGAHGGVAGPAHQLAEPGLVPAVLLAQDPDVRADNGRLV